MALIPTQCETVFAGRTCRAPLTETVMLPDRVKHATTTSSAAEICGRTLGNGWGYDSFTNHANLMKNIVCKRTGAFADPVQCCAGLVTTARGQTCDAKYVPENTACDPFLRTWCTGNGDPFSPACAKWAQRNQGEATAARRIYCRKSGNLNRAECREFCIREGQCDPAAVTYCDSSTADENFCACLRSKDPRPECLDVKCSSRGYRTDSMRMNQSCPAIVNCIANVKVDGNNNEINSNDIVQYCITNPTNPAGFPRPPVMNPPSTPTTGNPPVMNPPSTPTTGNPPPTPTPTTGNPPSTPTTPSPTPTPTSDQGDQETPIDRPDDSDKEKDAIDEDYTSFMNQAKLYFGMGAVGEDGKPIEGEGLSTEMIIGLSVGGIIFIIIIVVIIVLAVKKRSSKTLPFGMIPYSAPMSMYGRPY